MESSKQIRTKFLEMGFCIADTGGGCEAFVKSLSDSLAIYVTHSGGGGLPTKGNILVGLNEETDEGSETLEFLDTKSLSEAVDWVQERLEYGDV